MSGRRVLGSDEGAGSLVRTRSSAARQARRIRRAVRRQRRERHVSQWLRSARAAGDLDVADDQQAPPRGRLRHLLEPVGRHAASGSNFAQLVGMTEQCSPSCADQRQHREPGLRSARYAPELPGTIGWRGSASYVTGAHNMKFGYQGGHLIDNQYVTNDSS